jgi:transposase-like protein
MGKRSGLTPECQEKIIQAVRQGNFLTVSAGLAGIEESTLHKWIRLGETESSGKFNQFVKQLREAQAQAEALAVVTIRKASLEGDWKAAAWYLEKGPAKARWRPNLHIDYSKATDEELERELALIAGKLVGGSPEASGGDDPAGD